MTSQDSTPPPLPPVPGAKMLKKNPGVWVLDDVLSGPDCAELIALARPRLTPAMIGGKDAGGAVSSIRTGSMSGFRHDATPVLQAAVTRMAALAGLPSDHAEAAQILHYAIGQEYKPHHDAFNFRKALWRDKAGVRGQRLRTALAYLSEVAEGGTTEFPRLGLSISPRRGRVLIWDNCRPGTDQRHPASEHLASPVIEGEKWVLTLWFRERPRPEATGSP